MLKWLKACSEQSNKKLLASDLIKNMQGLYFGINRVKTASTNFILTQQLEWQKMLYFCMFCDK